jgi:hypothetical protein
MAGLIADRRQEEMDRDVWETEFTGSRAEKKGRADRA